MALGSITLNSFYVSSATSSSITVSYSSTWRNMSYAADWSYVTITNTTTGDSWTNPDNFNPSPSGSWTFSGLSPNTSYSFSISMSGHDTSGYVRTASGSTSGSTTGLPTYTVTWNPNGGSVSPTSSTVTAGGSVTAPTPTRDGYSFIGWTTSPSDTNVVVSGGGSYTPSSSITLYARWGSLPVASITINSVTSSTVSISWNNSANGGNVESTGIHIPAGYTWTGTGTVDSNGYVLGYSGSGTISGLSAASSYTVYAFINTLGWIGYPDGVRGFSDTKIAYTAVATPSWSDQTLSQDIYKDLPYSDSVAASPATSYSWSGYPPNLVLNSSTGIVSGTPTTEGTYTVTVIATNAGSGSYPSSSASFTTTLTVKPATPKVYTNSGWQRALAVWTYTGTQNGWQRAQVKARSNDQWNPPL